MSIGIGFRHWVFAYVDVTPNRNASSYPCALKGQTSSHRLCHILDKCSFSQVCSFSSLSLLSNDLYLKHVYRDYKRSCIDCHRLRKLSWVLSFLCDFLELSRHGIPFLLCDWMNSGALREYVCTWMSIHNYTNNYLSWIYHELFRRDNQQSIYWNLSKFFSSPQVAGCQSC